MVGMRRQLEYSVLFILTVALVALALLAKLYPYFPLDLAVTIFVQQFRSPQADKLMEMISILGSEPMVVALSAGGFLTLFLVMKKQKEALMLFLSVGGMMAIGEVLKKMVSRPRPDGALITQIGQYLGRDSFPSGHVLFFMGFFGFLACLAYLRLRGRNRRVVLSLLILLLILIGVSRIYLGAHWFSDTLGSYLIGVLWLYLVVVRFGPRLPDNLKLF